jgi:hypothetical protein
MKKHWWIVRAWFWLGYHLDFDWSHMDLAEHMWDKGYAIDTSPRKAVEEYIEDTRS